MSRTKKTYAYRKVLIMLVLPLIMQSCFVSKNYKRPDFALENLYRNFDNTDSATLASVPWEQLFPDPQLRNLIAEGLKNNLRLDSTYQNILIAQARYKQGKAQFLPSLNLNGNVSSSDFAENSATGRQFSGFEEEDSEPDQRVEQYDLLADLSWEADIWGRIRSIKQSRGAALLQSEAAYRAVQTRLIASIASSYYRLLALDAQLSVTERTVETRKQSLQTIKSLKASGIETGLAVKQQEAQIYTAQILEVDLRQQIALLEDSLSTILARNPGPIVRGSLENQVFDVPIEAGVPSQILRNRPDVIAAEYGLISAFEFTNTARAEFYPRLTITAEMGYQSLLFSNWISSASFYNTLLAGITAPIFRQRQLRTNYEIAQAEQQQALINFENTILTAGREVSDALINYDAEQQKYDLREKQVETLTTAEDYAYKLLKNGYANYLEVLRTTDEKLSAQIERINTQYDKLNALINLYRALGGGWKPGEEEMDE